MTEAVIAVIGYAFNVLKLERIDAAAFADNQPSCLLLKKVGFKEEGIRKRFGRCLYTKEFHDDMLFGLLK